jgi:hypothetical protein
VSGSGRLERSLLFRTKELRVFFENREAVGGLQAREGLDQIGLGFE